MSLPFVRSRRIVRAAVSALVTVLPALGCGGSGNAGEQDQKEGGSVGSTARSFEEFEKSLSRARHRVYIVDGDVPVNDIKNLREFYEQRGQSGALIVANKGGADTKWSNQYRYNLRYCVSNQFRNTKQIMVGAMQSATSAWRT